VKVHLSRWVCSDAESNLRRCAEEAAEAASAGSELVVFPESFLHGYTQTVAPALVREAFSRISGTHAGSVFVFGSFTEERRNRTTVWRGGKEIARYDKVHLFDPNDERRIWEPGERYAAVDTGPLRLGLLTCNDIRFPEQARALTLEGGCNALVVPSWWPWRRDHVWRTLLRARAIENGLFVLGCCVASSQTPGERFSGAGNYAFDPQGEPIRTDDDQSYELDLSLLGRLLVDPRRCFVDIGEVEKF
jgi:predicted amidohydrolase